MLARKRNPKVNIPGKWKVMFMGKGNRQFRLMFAEAIKYSENGFRNVAAQDAKKGRKADPSAADKITTAIAG